MQNYKGTYSKHFIHLFLSVVKATLNAKGYMKGFFRKKENAKTSINGGF